VTPAKSPRRPSATDGAGVLRYMPMDNAPPTQRVAWDRLWDWLLAPAPQAEPDELAEQRVGANRLIDKKGAGYGGK
jgi:hypothetical protein